MNLDDALRQIALAGDLNVDDLIGFAAEDTYPARGEGNWSGMAPFAAEVKVLYALIRALRPATVVEIGTNDGCSTMHILAALKANGKGKLISIDIEPSAGRLVPDDLRDRLTLVTGDALTVDLPKRFDFAFEDGEHSYEFTSAVLSRIKAGNPRAIVAHDYLMHHTYPDGFDVERAFVDTLGDAAFGLTVEDAFPGLGFWFNPAKASR